VGDQLLQLGDWPLEELPLGADRITGIELMVAATPPRTFEVAICPLVYLETRPGWILLVRDVTKERERQSYLRSQERLGTMGQMAAGIAHDFNNMLLVISLHIEMLYKNPATPKHQQYLETVMAQIQGATKLIKQMMDFGRRSMLQYSSVDLEEFAVTVQHLLRHTLPEHIQIEFTCAPGKYFVRADRTYLEQVWLNLSLNARDAMPRGGFLRMALDTLTFDADSPAPLPALLGKSWHRFIVADTGTGIAPENMTHIFDPFFTTKGPDEGTGLGLAQVYGIIKQHGGEILVESQVGHGTRFTLYFPATSEAGHVMEASPAAAALGGHETILVVEDESSLRNAVREVLSDLGYHVLLAGDGLEAEAIVEQMGEQIQLVVSDMVMPRMGGVQLYQLLKGKNPALPIILTTGYPLDTAGRELLMQEPVDWLQKPYRVNTLAKRIRAMLDK
jgi:signal transduction histidine kinase/CheY-like chemotaxis protein